MADPRSFPSFNPSAALLLDQIIFTITVDAKTGRMAMSSNRPDMNSLLVVDILQTQALTILRGTIQANAVGFGGSPPKKEENKLQGNLGGNEPV